MNYQTTELKKFPVEFDKLTPREKSLIIYLEDRNLNESGRLNDRNIDQEDKEYLKKWNTEGFIEYGRVPAAFRRRHENTFARISDSLMDLAYQIRREQIKGHWDSIPYYLRDEEIL